MARNKRTSESGGDTWLNTYADMVTLLLTFFAVLLSMSSVNEEKFNAFIQSFSNLPPEQIEEIINGGGSGTGSGGSGNSAEQTMDDLYQYLNSYIQENEQGDVIEISSADEVIYIRFKSDYYFEPNRYILREESYPSLSFIGDGIKQYEDEIQLINICGYTADPQVDNYQISEWRLSGERAATVAIYFEDEKNIDPNKMIVLGYGNNFPIAPNDSEENMQKNRRVELMIIGEDSSLDVSALLGSQYNQDQYPAAGGADDVLLPNTDSSGQTESSASDTSRIDSSSSTAASNPGVESDVSPYEDEP